LIDKYAIASADNLFLYLKKRSVPAPDRAPTEISSGRHALGSDVPVPLTKDAVIAEIGVEQTLIGRLLTTLYKPPELHISVALTGGETKTYRFIPGMAKSGFILSPLVNDTNDFIQLTASRDNLAKNTVKSFSVSPAGGKSLFWKDTYSVRLSEFTRPET